MKCPKCHYLSFDPEPRCKNCGYDLEVADADLAFRAAEEADQTLPDLTLRDEHAGDDAPITLELVRSAKLVHPDDAVEEKRPPKRPRVAPREPALAGAPRRARVDPPAPPASSWTDLMPVGRVSPPAAEEPPAAPVPAARTLQPVAPLEPIAPLVPIARAEPVAPVAPEPRVAEPNTPRLVLTPVEPEPLVAAEPAAAPAEKRAAPPADRVEPAPAPTAPATTDLPLFIRETKGRAEDLNSESPVETFMRQSGGRPPLVVRRPVEPIRPSAPAPPYAQRQERRVGPLDHDLLEDLRRVEREEAAVARAAELAARAAAGASDLDAAGESAAPSQRLTAAALDGFLLGGIGTFVLWATLRVTGVPASAFGLDAIVPLAIFLAGVAVSYLLMFTLAGGQTVGKMLAGIRVVPEDDPTERVSFRQAAARALLAPVSMAVLGLGWWPALFGRVAFHDRLVHTRVVRA
jgi:uncharacterized RDD family membrane protein YckC